MPEETQNLANEIGQFIKKLENTVENKYSLDDRKETSLYVSESSSSEHSGGFGDSVDESEVRDDALGVGQAEFGYLDNELRGMLGFEALETEVSSFIAVAYRDTDSGNVGLVHADKDGRKLDQVEEALEKSSDKVDDGFDSAKLVSAGSNDREFDAVEKYLNQEFDDVEVEHSGRESKSIGVDENGFYAPEDASVKVDSGELAGLELMARPGVKDIIQGRVEEWYQEQWDEYEDDHLPEPISEKWVTREGGGKKYSRRVHKPTHDKNEARYTVRFRVGDAEVEDLETEFDYDVTEAGGHRVIEIRSRHPIGEDRERVEAVNQEAAQVYEQIVE